MQGAGDKERVVRTRSGCITCRRRKKKCDETRSPETGGCIRCKNAGYECLGYPKRKSITSDHRPMQSVGLLSVEESTTAGPSSSSSSPPPTPPPQPPLVHQVLDTPILGAGPPLGPLGSPLSGSTSCSIVGRCILLGQPICAGCLSTIQPVLSPSDRSLDFSISTPFSHNIDATSHHKPVLQCLIGYYAVVLTCWVEGCHPRSIIHSVFFKELVQYLFARIDHDECLRLSIACCASGYIGGGQLSWPEDLVAIQEWTETLRQGATELVDVATTSTAPAGRHVDEGGDRLARHSYLDRHLSRHAKYLYRMASRSADSLLQTCFLAPSNASGGNRIDGSTTKYIDIDTMHQYNNLVLSIMSQAIFSWAELSIESYYQNFDTALQAVNTITAGVRRVKLKTLYTVETLGFATVVWGDVAAALARGTRPYFILEDEGPNAPNHVAFSYFNCPTPLLKCLSDLARLRFDCSVLPLVPSRTVVLPERLSRQASELESTLNSLAALTHPSTQFSGSPNCSEMTRLGAVILLYTLVYRKGPLHPTIKYSLQCILNLWQYGAKSFCVDVGCSNYCFAIFMASSVAHEASDRVICDEAMSLVGHNEATVDAGRMLIKEVWKRTDDGGMPVLWSDLVNEGSFLVAFL